MIAFHRKATLEYLSTIQRMQEKHYDRRAIARYIDEIETIFVRIDSDPFKAGKAEPWGPYLQARYCGPTTYGYRV